MPDISRASQTREKCLKRNCCWNRISYLEFPYCYHKLPTKEFYTITSRRSSNKYFSAKLNKNSSLLQQELEINVEQWNKNHLNINISPKTKANRSEYLFCHRTSNHSGKPIKVVHEDKDGRLFIRVKSEKRTLFDTRIGPLIFRNGYVEISSFLPSYNVYGLGQSKKRIFGIDLRTTTRWSLYSRHRSNDTRRINWSGVHPFYLCMENNGESHGVLIETIRPIEIQVTAGPLVTFRILDDNLRLHFFFGPTPAEVVSQLLECIGRPLFPPYWALGHHICYTNLTKAQEDIKQLRKDKVELQSACLTSEEQHGDEFKELIEDLHSNGQKLLLLQNPHINYENFTSDDYFILNSSLISGPFIGIIGNKSVAYPDFFNPNTANWSIEECRRRHFDGLVLNYNTPLDENGNSSKCEPNDNFAPYGIQFENLSKDTICWDSLHTNGTQHYEVHNMYGHKHLETIWKCANTKEKRPFIISSSTFLGSGKYGGNWGGPNFATWEDLQQAIIDMLEYNMYGIPLTGSPYCGFQGEFDQTLCSRWLQVSALSPLMIGYRGKDENPVDLITSSLISTVGKMVLRLRYSLIPYLYTLFYMAHVHKQTVVRPLFFEFPNDTKTYHLNGQYMLGSALLVSPVINPNVSTIKAYFPKGCWYSFYDGSPTISPGKYVPLSTIESNINLHVRGGHIIPSRSEGTTLTRSQDNNFTLTIALNCEKFEVLAHGELFFDDGESYYYSSLIHMKVEEGEESIAFTSWPDHNNSVDPEVSYNLKIIRLFGMTRELKGIYSGNASIGTRDVRRYDDQLVIQNLRMDLQSNISIILRL